MSKLEFIKTAEKLKSVLRHSWLSSGRQESVAEHSWMMAILAILFERNDLDMKKVFEMIALHDLAEALTGDIPAFEESEGKEEDEKDAMEEILDGLDEADRLWDLWMEYERKDSPEAEFVKALDVLEVIIQHNNADIETWEEVEKTLNLKHGREYTDKFPELAEFRKLVDEVTKKKVG